MTVGTEALYYHAQSLEGLGQCHVAGNQWWLPEHTAPAQLAHDRNVLGGYLANEQRGQSAAVAQELEDLISFLRTLTDGWNESGFTPPMN